MTVAEIDQKIAELTDEHQSNLAAIAEAESLKKRQREVTKKLAQLYREKAKASIADHQRPSWLGLSILASPQNVLWTVRRWNFETQDQRGEGGGREFVLASDYDALSARCAALEGLVERIHRKAVKERYELTHLMSNPPQNAAAYYIMDMIDTYRRGGK